MKNIHSGNICARCKLPEKVVDPLGVAGTSIELEPRDPSLPPPEKIYLGSIEKEILRKN